MGHGKAIEETDAFPIFRHLFRNGKTISLRNYRVVRKGSTHRLEMPPEVASLSDDAVSLFQGQTADFFEMARITLFLSRPNRESGECLRQTILHRAKFVESCGLA